MDDDAIASSIISANIKQDISQMLLTTLLQQLPNISQIVESAIAELEYYAAYDPDVINCAIAFAIFKPTEIVLTYGIEYLSAFFNGDRKVIQKTKS